MSGRARALDPITSQEAGDAVDLIRSQRAVLAVLRAYYGEFFTLRAVTDHYRVLRREIDAPALSDARVRTAICELRRRGIIEHVGYTKPPRGERRMMILRLTD